MDKIDTTGLTSQSQAAKPTIDPAQISEVVEQYERAVEESGAAKDALAAHIAGTSQATKAQAAPDLHGTMDAKVWADEFCRLNNCADHGMMLAWFANAIMVGWDFAKREVASVTKEAEKEQQAMTDEVRERVRDAVADALKGLYYCGRVWSAWSVGTMSEDDFSPAEDDDDIIENVTAAALGAIDPTTSTVSTWFDSAMDTGIVPAKAAQAAPEEVRNQALEEAAKHFEADVFDQSKTRQIASEIRALKRTSTDQANADGSAA